MIVGRDPERAAVGEVVDAIVRGTGGVVVVTGERGVGSSALADEVLADRDDLRTVRITCTPAETDIAWAGLCSLVVDLRAHLDDVPERPRQLLAGLVGWGPPVHGDPVAAGMAGLALLIAAAEHAPHVVLIDDAHRLDAESRAVFEFVARRLAGLAVGLLVVSSADEPGFAPQGRQITLHDLDHRAALTLLRRRGLADPVAAEVIAECGTRPLVLVDVADRLGPEQRNGAAPLPTPLPAGSAADLYAERIAALAPSERQALAVLALSSRDELGSELAPALGLHLAQAEQLGLVHRDASGLDLAHPLVGRAVLASVDAAGRRAAHRRLAGSFVAVDHGRARWHRALAAEGPDPDLADELEQAGADAAAAGQPLEAYRLLYHAARISPPTASRRRWLAAVDAAITARLTAAAATLLDQLEQRDAAGADIQLRRARLLQARGDLHGARGALLTIIDDPAIDLAVRTSARLHAAALCLRTYDLLTLERLTSPAALDQLVGPEACATLARVRTAGFASIGDPAAIAAVVDHTRAAIDHDVAPHELVELAETFAIALARAGRRPELFHLADVVQRRATERGVPSVAPSLLIARAAYLGRSDLVGALDTATEAVELIEELHHDEYLAQALTHRANALAGLGDPASLELADRIEAYGGPLAEGAATVVRCAYHRTVGDHRGLVDAVEATHWRIGRRPELSVLWHLDLFEAALALGRHDLTADIRDTLATLLAWGGASWVRAGLGRVDGLLAADLDTAVDAWQQSATTFDERGYSINAGRTELVWAERLVRDGDPTGAHTVALRARTRFAVAGMAMWKRRCDDLLGRAGAPATTPATTIGPATDPHDDDSANRVLTPRELQVARWLVEGSTYRQVADRLFVSTRTVESHCGAIYRKLGVRGRSGLAARALTDRTLQMLPDTP